MVETVAIVTGVPCQECGVQIEKQEDRPVVFFDVEQNRDLIYHEDCLGIEQTVALLVYQVEMS